MRALCRSIACLVVIGLVTLMSVTSALAHATYKSSNPDDESTVSSPPSQITAEFTEPMTGGSYMDVTDPCGRDVGSGSSQTGTSMSVQSSGTAAGRYVVFWSAHSIDGHVTEGEFTFTSTGGDACPGEEEEEVDAGGGGGGGPGNGGSSDGGGDSTDGGDSGSTGGHAGHSKGSRSQGEGAGNQDGRGGGSPGSGGGDDSTTALADGPRSDVPDAPSALEGIPLDGLLITLAVAALIGAAAGKIYVSLSGDE